MPTVAAGSASPQSSSAPLLPRHGKVAFSLVTGFLGVFAFTNIVLLLTGILRPGWVGLIAVLLTSFFMSLMFPTIFALGIRDLHEHTKEGASLLVMAIIGGAIFTPLMGLAYQATKSMAACMTIPLFCYAVVAAFAFWGAHAVPHLTRPEGLVNEVPIE